MLGLDRRSVFLFDGCGAVVSVLLLGGLLPALQAWIGMPLRVLYLLALLPVLFGAYSFGCYRFADHQEPRWLLAVMVANLSYCGLTLSLVALHWEQLTPLGVAWFGVDALVIGSVVALEARVLRRDGVAAADAEPSTSASEEGT